MVVAVEKVVGRVSGKVPGIALLALLLLATPCSSTIMVDSSLESRRDLRLLRRELSGLRRRRGSLIIVAAGGGLPVVALVYYGIFSFFLFSSRCHAIRLSLSLGIVSFVNRCVNVSANNICGNNSKPGFISQAHMIHMILSMGN